MAYDFVSPGAEASMMINELLRRRMLDARQRMLDEAQQEDRRVNRQIQQANLDTLASQRQAIEDDRRTNQAKTVMAPLAPGQALNPSTSDVLKRGGFGALIKPGEETYGSLPPEEGEGPTLETTPDTFTGTAAQIKAREDRTRLENYLKTLAPDSAEAKALRYRLETGENAPAGMFDRQASQSQDIQEYEYYVKQAKDAGQQPMTFEAWMKWAANLKNTNAGNGSGTPYFLPIQTANGVVPFNARTGQFEDAGRRDLKPGEGAQTDLTRAGSVLFQIGEIAKNFTPDRMGPLKGRYNSMKLALLGESGDQGLAAFDAQIANLKNTVINLRTGAQMNESEAQRILAEVPDLNQPPDVFMAKLENAQRYFRDWYARRSGFAFGRTPSTQVDGMVNGVAPGLAPPPPTDPNMSQAPRKLSAAEARKKYGY